MASKRESLSNVSQALATTSTLLYSSRLCDFMWHQNPCLAIAWGVGCFLYGKNSVPFSLSFPLPHHPLHFFFQWRLTPKLTWKTCFNLHSALSRLMLSCGKGVITQAVSILNTTAPPNPSFPKENLPSFNPQLLGESTHSHLLKTGSIRLPSESFQQRRQLTHNHSECPGAKVSQWVFQEGLDFVP